MKVSTAKVSPLLTRFQRKKNGKVVTIKPSPTKHDVMNAVPTESKDDAFKDEGDSKDNNLNKKKKKNIKEKGVIRRKRKISTHEEKKKEMLLSRENCHHASIVSKNLKMC